MGRRPRAGTPISRDRIVDTALAIIDHDGPDGLSMRRLAGDMDVGTMSLYHHVPNKAALLEAVAERVATSLEESLIHEGDWRQQARNLATAFRDVALAHPQAVTLLMTHHLSSPAGSRLVLHCLESLNDAGLEPGTAVQVLRVFLSYVVGELVRETRVTELHSLDADLEFGIELILDSVARLVDVSTKT